ncbi:hypothetical protein [Haliea sp. E17]|uniref:hypothetical protein n=1 Tax=Haliea sp. E17 TaxID=3401576 RepID=UPI003AAFA363
MHSMSKKTLYWCLFAILLLAVAVIQFIPAAGDQPPGESPPPPQSPPTDLPSPARG